MSTPTKIATNLSPLAQKQLSEVAEFYPDAKLTSTVDARVRYSLARSKLVKHVQLAVPGFAGKHLYTVATKLGRKVAAI